MASETTTAQDARDDFIASRNAFARTLEQGKGAAVFVVAIKALESLPPQLAGMILDDPKHRQRIISTGVNLDGDSYRFHLLGTQNNAVEMDECWEQANRAGALILREGFCDLVSIRPNGAEAWFVSVFADLRDTRFVQQLPSLKPEAFAFNPFSASIEFWNRILASLGATVRPTAVLSSSTIEPIADTTSSSSAADTDELPTIDSAVANDYVELCEINAKHLPTNCFASAKKLTAFLDQNRDSIRQGRPRAINGKPRLNRRLIHLGDWTKQKDNFAEWFAALSEAKNDEPSLNRRNQIEKTQKAIGATKSKQQSRKLLPGYSQLT